MRYHYNNFKHNKGMPEKRVNLETVLVDCVGCGRETSHLYLGNFGVPWKPQFAYQCYHCKKIYVSLKKLK